MVDECWKEIKSTTLNNSWNKLLPYLVEKNQAARTREFEYVGVIREAVNIGRNISGEGFSDLQESELLDWESSDEPLSVCEIEEILENQPDEDMIADEDEENVPTLSAKTVGDLLISFQKHIDQAMEMDPIMTRSLQFKRDCEKAIQNYKILYKDSMRRAKQTRLTDYFSQNK